MTCYSGARGAVRQRLGEPTVHRSLPASGQAYDLAKVTPLVVDRHMTTFITRLAAPPPQMAEANNALQELAEQQPLGIPITGSTA
jgi:beta-glucosidase